MQYNCDEGAYEYKGVSLKKRICYEFENIFVDEMEEIATELKLLDTSSGSSFIPFDDTDEKETSNWIDPTQTMDSFDFKVKLEKMKKFSLIAKFFAASLLTKEDALQLTFEILQDPDQDAAMKRLIGLLCDSIKWKVEIIDFAHWNEKMTVKIEACSVPFKIARKKELRMLVPEAIKYRRLFYVVYSFNKESENLNEVFREACRNSISFFFQLVQWFHKIQLNADSACDSGRLGEFYRRFYRGLIAATIIGENNRNFRAKCNEIFEKDCDGERYCDGFSEGDFTLDEVLRAKYFKLFAVNVTFDKYFYLDNFKWDPNSINAKWVNELFSRTYEKMCSEYIEPASMRESIASNQEDENGGQTPFLYRHRNILDVFKPDAASVFEIPVQPVKQRRADYLKMRVKELQDEVVLMLNRRIGVLLSNRYNKSDPVEEWNCSKLWVYVLCGLVDLRTVLFHRDEFNGKYFQVKVLMPGFELDSFLISGHGEESVFDVVVELYKPNPTEVYEVLNKNETRIGEPKKSVKCLSIRFSVSWYEIGSATLAYQIAGAFIREWVLRMAIFTGDESVLELILPVRKEMSIEGEKSSWEKSKSPVWTPMVLAMGISPDIESDDFIRGELDKLKREYVFGVSRKPWKNEFGIMEEVKKGLSELAIHVSELVANKCKHSMGFNQLATLIHSVETGKNPVFESELHCVSMCIFNGMFGNENYRTFLEIGKQSAEDLRAQKAIQSVLEEFYLQGRMKLMLSDRGIVLDLNGLLALFFPALDEVDDFPLGFTKLEGDDAFVFSAKWCHHSASLICNLFEAHKMHQFSARISNDISTYQFARIKSNLHDFTKDDSENYAIGEGGEQEEEEEEEEEHDEEVEELLITPNKRTSRASLDAPRKALKPSDMDDGN